MEDERTISDYGFQEEVTLIVIRRMRGGGGDSPDHIKRLFGLYNIAQAISLWDWDGIMPGSVSLTLVVYRSS